jgi:hypothetical protein
MTSNDKHLWIERWLGCINELTSLDFQKISWFNRTHTNPHWSFVEFMCSYFDDLAIDEYYEYQLNPLNFTAVRIFYPHAVGMHKLFLFSLLSQSG